MHVDVKKNGLDFTTEEFKKIKHKGCRVDVELYELLDASSRQAVEREVPHLCKYVDVDLYMNGEQINVDPNTEKWDYETEDGWMKVISNSLGRNSWSSGKGVDVYQQGVFVENIPEYRAGVGGTIVTKLPLKLNFARNQVMRGQCPRWKRMHALMTQASQDSAKKKLILNTAERSAMVDQLRNREISYHDTASMRLFQDAQNKTWSANQIAAATSKKTKWKLTPSRQLVVSFAELYDRKADKVMQRKMALVLDNEVLDQWGIQPEEFPELLGRWRYGLRKNVIYKPLDEIDMSEVNDHRILNEEQLTPRERMVLEIIESAQWSFRNIFYDTNESREPRLIRAGESSTADGWTDGSSYIAINVGFLRNRIKRGLTWAMWYEIAALVLHEYCHSDSDTSSHSHDPHFYQLYHDTSTELSWIVDAMFRRYLKRLETNSKKVPKRLQLQALKEAESIQRGLAMDFQHGEKLRLKEKKKKQDKTKVSV